MPTPLASEALVVLTTVSDMDEAQRIAKGLLEARVAACVNIVPGLRSVYRWEGKVCDDAELLLISKTHRRHFDELAATIRALHSYEVPEIIALPAAAIDSAYAAWLGNSLG